MERESAMDIKDLRYFCVTAELEHITKAAEKMNIAQPYLTRVIHQIEEEAGGELFDKTGRRIRLNANGQVFYKYAKRVLADMDVLHSEMDYLFERREQTVTLTCNIESFSRRLVLAFNQEKPDYSLEVLNATYPEVVAALISGETQFALTSPPIPTDSAKDIETIPIFASEGLLLLPPGHPLLGQEKVGIDEIREDDLVTMPRGSGMRIRLQPIFDLFDYRPRIVLESNNLDVITSAVMAGVGIAFVTDVILADHPELRENIVRVDEPDVVGYYGLSYNRFTVEGRRAKEFLEFIKTFFSELQWVINSNTLD